MAGLEAGDKWKKALYELALRGLFATARIRHVNWPFFSDNGQSEL